MKIIKLAEPGFNVFKQNKNTPEVWRHKPYLVQTILHYSQRNILCIDYRMEKDISFGKLINTRKHAVQPICQATFWSLDCYIAKSREIRINQTAKV